MPRRYLKRYPVVFASKLQYTTTAKWVVHHDYEHWTKQYRQQTLRQEEMIKRYINHIPARHFKMICYYAFLLNHSGEK
ncbi:MAG: transposase [Arsenophonus sp. NEOnobi-MAG3]